jgi:hypothetical protein
MFVLALAGLAGCGRSDPPVKGGPASNAAASVPSVNPVPDGSGDCVRPAKDYASTRFSPLDQITKESARQLGVE